MPDDDAFGILNEDELSDGRLAMQTGLEMVTEAWFIIPSDHLLGKFENPR